jgi:HEAT repeat protein/CheY-like chemotaxis protein
MSRPRFIACLIVASLLLPVIIPVLTNTLRAEGEDEKIRSLWAQGVEFFEQARYEEAFDKFNECLAARPSSQMALELREAAGYAFFVKALASPEKEYGKDIAFIVRKVLELAEEQVKIDRTEEAKIKDMLDKVKNSPFVEKYQAMEMIASTVGQYVVPFCVATLGNRMEDEFRTEIIILLSRLGADAVLPVIEILDSPDSFTRQNGATVLGNIGDERSIAALKKLLDDPREDRIVKKEAYIALMKITNQDPSRLESAPEYYYRLAERYYYDDLSIIYSNYKDWAFWFWSGDALHFKIVERFEYNDMLAEEACYDGIAVSKSYNYDALWTLLACVYYAQVNEVQSALDVANELVEKGNFPTDKKEILEKRRKLLETAEVVNYALGKRRMLKALRRSLDDRNALVAVSCINALRDLEDDGALLPESEPAKPGATEKDKPADKDAKKEEEKLGAALTNSLIYPDKRVRYAASECLVKMNPKKRFAYADRVIQNLMDALGEWKPRVILVIEPDEVIRTNMKATLTDLGYFPVMETTGISGLNRARQFPTDDLIIISTELPDLTGYEVIDTLRHDPRTVHVPVIVSCPPEKLQKVQSLYSDKANDVISVKDEKLTVGTKIADIFERVASTQPDVTVRADRIAKNAAETLKIVDLSNGNFQPVAALDDLIKNVQGPRSDIVRNPALQAIGHLGMSAMKALPTLINVFNNRQNSVEIRVNAADAIADILRPDERYSEAAFKALKESLNEDNINIRKAAAKALGAMNMTPLQYWPVATEQRVHKPIPETAEGGGTKE